MKTTKLRQALNDPSVLPIHSSVPGRARFRVAGLKANQFLKARLEEELTSCAGIHTVDASTVTGKVLLLFAPEREHLWAARELAGVLARELPLPAQQERAPKTPGPVKAPSAIDETEEHDWHRHGLDRILQELWTSEKKGLSPEVAARRLKEHGPNRLPQPEAKSRLGMFLDQFMSLPVALLGAAAGLSFLTGGILDAAVIGGVLVANSCIGFITENASDRAIQSQQRVTPPAARVRRQGKVRAIDQSEIVPGDVLLLQPGTSVPADARIIRAENLTVEESSLTGESLPVDKTAKALKKKRLPVADRINLAFMGTVVTGGQGVAVVVATGQKSELGKLHRHLAEAESPRPPIERKLARTGNQLVKLWAGVCVAVFGLGLFRGYPLLHILGISVSLAAAAVPEGLPAASTTTFALGMRRMRKQGIMIRRLPAMETLGSVQTICFDKTGTITRNEMEVAEIFCGGDRIRKEGSQLLAADQPVDLEKRPELHQTLLIWALCSQVKINGAYGSDLPELIGSSTENALIRLALEQGFDVKSLRKKHGLIEVRHRSQKSPIMSTLHSAPDGSTLHAVKGSPLKVLQRCDKQMKDGRIVPLTEADRREIAAENERMAGEAYRVLGTSMHTLSSPKDAGSGNGFVWLGLVGLTDPLRSGVAEAIRGFHQAGIRTVMITGDQRLTAESVARKLNLSNNEPLRVMDAEEMKDLDPEDFARKAEKVHVFARVTPSDKLKIVQALQRRDHIVAMTGDGINDGPALKAADVGIAMGDGGTDAAKDVADVVLQHDDLDTLIQALRDGRTTYTNIRKSVHFFLATNLSEIMLMSGALAVGIGAPLSSMQLLWINLISDIFPGLALSMEPQEPDVLEQPPRDPQAPLFSRADYARMTAESGVITAASMGAYTSGLLRYGPGLQAGAMAFHSLTLSQLVHAYSCRSESRTVVSPKRPASNPWIHAAVGGSIGVHLLTMFLPGFRGFLNLAPLGLYDLGIILASIVSSFGINEAFKAKQPGQAAQGQLSLQGRTEFTVHARDLGFPASMKSNLAVQEP